MEFFKQNTQIDFMALRKWAGGFSVLISVIAIIALAVNGLNWGLEFTGGTEINLAFENPVDLAKVRQTLADKGYTETNVQSYGTLRNVLIRIGGRQEELEEKSIGQEIGKLFSGSTVQSVSYIGPAVGKELATNGALALFVALIGTAIYIAFRFEYRFAASAAVAIIHDPIIILGVFSITQMEFDLISLAAVLTVIGYSLNDTVVVFDRVRENFRKLRKGTPAEIINLSVNQTLSRTIMTSGLTVVAVLALFLFGGQKLHGFSAALLIGIVIGTYSSIYVAGALSVALGLNRKDLLPPTSSVVDDRP
jgi:preprotein translocase subunit SecF